MMASSRSLIILAAMAAPLALGACAKSDMAMPTGYVYHNQIYKAPPGPEASKPAKFVEADLNRMRKIGSESVVMEEEIQYGPDGQPIGGSAAFRGVADDLVKRMLRNFGRPMEPVFVNDSSPMAPALRDSLNAHSVPVAINPGDGPFVLDNSVEGQNASITFYSNHDPVTSEAGNYPVVQ